MKYRLIVLILTILALCHTQTINPYHVLDLEQTASEQQVRAKYKTLKKSAKNNHIKQQLYDDAYKQIMIDSTLQMTLSKSQKNIHNNNKPNRRRNRRRRGMPRLSDMFRTDYFAPKQPKSPSQKALEARDQKNYAQQILGQQILPQHEYRLPSQFDDPSFYKDQNKAQQTLKDQKIAFNKKVAGYVLFFAGIFLKLSPCFCIFLIWKYSRRGQREENDENNPFTKAINGWTGKNRRPVNKKNK